MFKEFTEVRDEKNANLDGVERSLETEQKVQQWQEPSQYSLIAQVFPYFERFGIGNRKYEDDLLDIDFEYLSGERRWESDEPRWLKEEYSNGKYAIFHDELLDEVPEGISYTVFNERETMCRMPNGTGEYFCFYPDGTLNEHRSYKEHKLEGSVTGYREDGTLKAEVLHKAGFADGIAKWYQADGKTLSHEVNLKKGKMHGLSTHYRRDGSKLSEMRFEEGKPVGLKRIFDKNGKTVAQEVPYNGTCKELGYNGKVIKTTKYVDGVPENKETGKVSDILRDHSQTPQQTGQQSNGQNQAVAKAFMNAKFGGR